MGKIEQLDYDKTVQYFWDKLGTACIMQLAASADDRISVRSVSCIMYSDAIVFKTDKNFDKTKQLLKNPNVAMCKYNINVEGIAENRGLVVDEPDRKFEKLYAKHLDGSYNAYSHVDTEILVAVYPKQIEIWDCDENNYAFQILVDMEKKTAVKQWYDKT